MVKTGTYAIRENVQPFSSIMLDSRKMLEEDKVRCSTHQSIELMQLGELMKAKFKDVAILPIA